MREFSFSAMVPPFAIESGLAWFLTIAGKFRNDG
jgi:hypothetical protein